MKEIEFRAWHKKNKKLDKVNGIDFNNKYIFCQGEDNIYSDAFSFDEVIIEQYTGLKDKNGKKIYEGDIVSFNYRCCKECPTETYRAIIEFGNPNGVYNWGFEMKFIGKVKPSNTDILLWIEMPDVECVVIGNIHENPELLGKEVAK